ncbi:MAG: fibronectin type III domain-containing protein [bacterium]
MSRRLLMVFILTILFPSGCGESSNSGTSADVNAPVISNLNISPLANGAAVSWATNELATSQVRYGESPNVGRLSAPHKNYALEHRVELTDLKAGATYYIIAKSEDPEGNEANSESKPFTYGSTEPQPLAITDLSVTPASNSARITWLTNRPATTQVFYGKTPGLGLSTTLQTQLTISHTVNLPGLESKTLYYFKVESRDAQAESAFKEGNFTTGEPDEATPLIITNLSASSTVDSARITWLTNRPATTQVFYGKTPQLGLSTTKETQLTTSHTVNLTGLESDTLYYFEVESEDAKAEKAFQEGSFRTKEPGTTTLLIITNLSAHPTVDSAQITWATNRPATTQVFYGKTPQLGLSIPKETQLTTSHVVNLTGLEPDTTYYFKVESQEAEGIFVRQEGSFATIAPSQDIPLLKIVPASKEAKVGDQFALEVRIEKVTNLFQTSFRAAFDPKVITAKGAEPGEFLGEDVVFLGMPDNEKGTIELAITRKGEMSGVSGSGVLAIINFKAENKGTTAIGISRDDLLLKVKNETGNLVGIDTVIVQGAEIVVK